jgi:hypothetical protein
VYYSALRDSTKETLLEYLIGSFLAILLLRVTEVTPKESAHASELLKERTSPFDP